MKIYTYLDQPPENLTPWRLGEACVKAARGPAGDYIDTGLGLLRELQVKGYGIVSLEQRVDAGPLPTEDELLVVLLTALRGRGNPAILRHAARIALSQNG